MDIVDLCNTARSANSGNCADDFDNLKSIVGNIMIRYEVIKPGTGCKDPQDMFGHLAGANVGRVVLTSDRSKSDFNTPLVRQCNGVVLEYPSWRVLAMPPEMFNPRFSMRAIERNINVYTIYKIRDGTTVTLYWHEPSQNWCMASTNGYDVSNYKWMGERTYMEIFRDVAKKYDFTFDRLDRNKSYTIGFRSNEFHPLLADGPDMWLIQSCDIAALNAHINSATDRAASFGNFINVNDDIGIPVQTSVPVRKDILKIISRENLDALSNYMRTSRIHYGYILRGDNGASSNIMLESTLLSQIRKLMYNLPKVKGANNPSINHSNRLEYNILRAYMNYNHSHTFIHLFPQFADYYNRYDQLFNQLTAKVLNIMNDRKQMRVSSRDKLSTLARIIVGKIEDFGYVNPMNSANIVRDFIYDSTNFHQCYEYLIA